MEEGFPYKECKGCGTIANCPHPDCDLVGSPKPPDECMKPWDVLTETWKEESKERRKKKNDRPVS